MFSCDPYCSKDLANFHRPKAVWYPHHNEVAAKEQGTLSVSGPMKVILKTMGGKGSRLIVDASDSLESVKVKAARKFGGKIFEVYQIDDTYERMRKSHF